MPNIEYENEKEDEDDFKRLQTPQRIINADLPRLVFD
jgi:hypothetical protein